MLRTGKRSEAWFGMKSSRLRLWRLLLRHLGDFKHMGFRFSQVGIDTKLPEFANRTLFVVQVGIQIEVRESSRGALITPLPLLLTT